MVVIGVSTLSPYPNGSAHKKTALVCATETMMDQTQAQAHLARLFELLLACPHDAPLLILPDQVLTYGEMQRRSLAVAGGLVAAGLRRGDSIALLLNNTPDWLAVAFAAWRLGLGVLALNPRLGSKEIADLVSRAGARALFYVPAYRGGACGDAVQQADWALLTSLQLLVSCDGTPPRGGPARLRRLLLDDLPASGEAPYSASPQDACLYLATSGTTSQPKIVVHVQERLFRHAHDAAAAIRYGSGARTLLAIPFCGGYGLAVTMTSLAAGTPIVLMDAFDPANASDLVRRHAVTHAIGTNDMLHKMLAVTRGERPFPTLRMFGYARFAPGLEDLPAEAERRGVPIRSFYGLTETLAFVAARPADAPLAERAEGGGYLVCPDAVYRIADPETGVALPPGLVGEIQIRSPNALREYLGDPVRTAQAFTPDRYLRTGDLGVQSPDGSFTFVARMNDMLRIGGYLVSPEEIEAVIKGEDGVATCQVVSVQLPEGSRPVAFVVPLPGARFDTDSALNRCRRDLATYKVPVRIFLVTDLPVTEGPNGTKVKRTVLRDMAVEALSREAGAAHG